MDWRLIARTLILFAVAGAVPQARALESSDERVGQINNAFAVDLYERLASESDKNVFFSPTSVQTALAMTWEGARGATAQEMARTLHLLNDPAATKQLAHFLRSLNAPGEQRRYELSVANALWATNGYPFLPDYLHIVETAYDGHLAELDFDNAPEAARKTINDWVAGKTHNRILNLLGRIPPGTRLVLTNALYFKSAWRLPFDKKATADADFSTVDGQRVKAPFMHQTADFQYAEDDTVQMLELQYGQGDLVLRLFLPKSADGLPEFEKAMTARKLNNLAEHSRRAQVSVSLPRFKLETRYELQDELPKMGMRLAFEPQADFSGMSSAESFRIGQVIHKAFCQVDEDGTEAAAATAILMLGSAYEAPPERKVFRADHPFLFAIVHRASGAMLFIGRLEKP